MWVLVLAVLLVIGVVKYFIPLEFKVHYLSHMQGKYKVYNLCSERLYDASLLEGKVCHNFLCNLLDGKYRTTFVPRF